MNNGIEDGWYYIKLGLTDDSPQVSNLELALPPTRCILVEDDYWAIGESRFYISSEMIEAPAFKVGEEVQVRDDNDKEWKNVVFYGYKFRSTYPYWTACQHSYSQCRLKPKPTIEITVKINGTQTELSDDMQARILECLATKQ